MPSVLISGASRRWAAFDSYLGVIAQIRMPVWTLGRVALIGDATRCPLPASGQGTRLAIVGSFVLAEDLAKAPADHVAAFAAY